MIAQRNIVLALAFIGIGLGAGLSAQTRGAPATLDDLLAELRGLRADMAKSSDAAVQTQMLVARIQIQEQRVHTVLRQITEVQNTLAAARQDEVGLGTPLKQTEDALARATEASAHDRRQLELELADMKLHLLPRIAQAQQRVQELTLRESELMGQYSAEQVRWNDFNDRLDALERSLQSR